MSEDPAPSSVTRDQVDDGDAERPRWYRSLFWRAAGRDTTSISAGTLDEPTGLRTIAQIHTADAGDYYEIAGEGARHEGELP